MSSAFRKHNFDVALFIRKEHFFCIIYAYFNCLFCMYRDYMFTICLCIKLHTPVKTTIGCDANLIFQPFQDAKLAKKIP